MSMRERWTSTPSLHMTPANHSNKLESLKPQSCSSLPMHLLETNWVCMFRAETSWNKSALQLYIVPQHLGTTTYLLHTSKTWKSAATYHNPLPLNFSTSYFHGIVFCHYLFSFFLIITNGTLATPPFVNGDSFHTSLPTINNSKVIVQ